MHAREENEKTFSENDVRTAAWILLQRYSREANVVSRFISSWEIAVKIVVECLISDEVVYLLCLITLVCLTFESALITAFSHQGRAKGCLVLTRWKFPYKSKRKRLIL